MKALRRAGWGLTAGLLLASPALAQYGARIPGQNSPTTPRAATIVPTQPTATIVTLSGAPNAGYYTPGLPKASVIQPISHTATVATVTGLPAGYTLQSVDGQQVTTPVLDSHTKLEEMKVELALMADPATFGCNLSARLDGKAMLVNGYVPNDAVREKAIQIARTGTHLVVADGMKIHRTLAMRSAGVPTEKLQQGAAELLRESFPEIASGFEIKATIIGQITLTGSARSYEEKLNVSERLRRLNGCTSVVNELKVTPLMKDGQALTMVTADGLCVVPPEVAEATSEAMVPAMPAIRVTGPVQGVLTVNPRAVVPPPPPSHPTVMEAMPAVRTLPSSLPTAKPAHGVGNGTVTFEDEPEAKQQPKN
jgi:hypothetical protein